MASILNHPVVRAVNPTTTGSAARSDPAVTVVTLAAVLIALNTWKSQTTPDLHVVGKDVLLVLGLVAAATVAPRPVVGILWIALLVWVLRNGADIEGLIRTIGQATPTGGQ